MELLSQVAVIIDEVARAGSIRRAAERMNISASSVNRHILHLEARLGVPLFERLPRGMRLTEIGAVMVSGVRRWREEHERIGFHIEEIRGLRRGHVRIGIMESLASPFMLRVYRHIAQACPNLSLEIVVGGTDMIVDRLADSSLDLAICSTRLPRDHVKVLHAFTPRIGIMVAPSHPLAARKGVELRDCTEFNMIISDRSLTLMATVEKLFQASSMTLQPLITTNSITLMKGLVREHQHIGVMGHFDVAEDVAAGTLVFIPLDLTQTLGNRLALLMREHAAPNQARTVIARLLEAEMALL